ncbi:hypothetical protein B7494_g47 [Chlorociboria aeruginascens]|nr:hypothetical protein B7494_g47 [Chlorociboria aeruginascens]
MRNSSIAEVSLMLLAWYIQSVPFASASLTAAPCTTTLLKATPFVHGPTSTIYPQTQINSANERRRLLEVTESHRAEAERIFNRQDFDFDGTEKHHPFHADEVFETVARSGYLNVLLDHIEVVLKLPVPRREPPLGTRLCTFLNNAKRGAGELDDEENEERDPMTTAL